MTREIDNEAAPRHGAASSASGPGLTSQQLHLLGLMTEAAKLSPEAFLDGAVKLLTGVSSYDDLTQAHFRVIADGFVAIGFRHPALPILSAAQRACLNRCRRRMGLSGRAALDLFRDNTGVASRRRMTGTNFVSLMVMFEAFGAGEPLPEPGFMTRRHAMSLRRKAWRVGLGEAALRDMMLRLGGTLRTRQLDERAYTRVLISLGPTKDPEPAPVVDGDPGMVTQAQANVIWKLWHDARPGADVSDGNFELAVRLLIGLPGGFDTLTRAGARSVMDAFKASLLAPVDLSGRRAPGEAASRRPS